MKRRILLELDAYLDTRIATVARLNQQAAIDLVTKPDYAKRLTDEMGLLTDKITTEEYRKAYEARDVETLMLARPTEMVILLNRIVAEIEKESLGGNPEVTGIEIDVNVWPYNLTADEMKAICQSIGTRCGVAVKIEAVRIPIEELTFELIRSSKWTDIIMYHGRDWYERCYVKNYHMVPPRGVPTANMLWPDILAEMSRVKDHKSWQPAEGLVITPYTALKAMFAEQIGVEVLPAAIFSLFGLLKPEEVFTNVV